MESRRFPPPWSVEKGTESLRIFSRARANTAGLQPMVSKSPRRRTSASTTSVETHNPVYAKLELFAYFS
jgi:hypothetical protein